MSFGKCLLPKRTLEQWQRKIVPVPRNRHRDRFALLPFQCDFALLIYLPINSSVQRAFGSLCGMCTPKQG